MWDFISENMAHKTEQHTPVFPSTLKALNNVSANSISGVEMVSEGAWTSAPQDAIICGLKELPESSEPITNQHIYFAHAYKVPLRSPCRNIIFVNLTDDGHLDLSLYI